MNSSPVIGIPDIILRGNREKEGLIFKIFLSGISSICIVIFSIFSRKYSVIHLSLQLPIVQTLFIHYIIINPLYIVLNWKQTHQSFLNGIGFKSSMVYIHHCHRLWTLYVLHSVKSSPDQTPYR